MIPDITELKNRLAAFTDIKSTSSLLYWDQATNLPINAGDDRSRQIATLTKLGHDILVSDDVGRMISDAYDWAARQDQDNEDAAFVREAKRLRDLDTRIPLKLNMAMAQHFSTMYDAWAAAAPKNDFKFLQPFLEQSVNYSMELANCFPEFQHPMDALIQFNDPGTTTTGMRQIFASLRADLVPLVQKVRNSKQINRDCLEGDFDEAAQMRFCRALAEAIGYDFRRGRMDMSPHPFMTRLGGHDVRITTRVRRDDMTDCMFSVIHEVGHALYEMGIRETLNGSILSSGVSSGVHESQSRLWENRIGRGKPFWDYFYPILQKEFPTFNRVSPEEFLRAINQVEPGLIRVDADELTYNLHVMIRFDLECDVLEGKLKIKDLPDAWNARYESDLGVKVPSFNEGCLQDVHWFSGPFGGSFQGYTIGNMLSAQIYDAALRDMPTMESEFSKGNFYDMRRWLYLKLHQWGSMLRPDDLIRHATGESLSSKAYVAYLTKKYRDLYRFS
jgi:carboxypeptidase Taq